MFDITILYLMVCCSKSIRGIESPGVPVFRRIGNWFFLMLSSTGLLCYPVLSSAAYVMLHELISTITTGNGSGIWTHHVYEWMAPCILGFELCSLIVFLCRFFTELPDVGVGNMHRVWVQK